MVYRTFCKLKVLNQQTHLDLKKIVWPSPKCDLKLKSRAAGRPQAFSFCLSHRLDAVFDSTEQTCLPQTQLKNTAVGHGCVEWVARLQPH